MKNGRGIFRSLQLTAAISRRKIALRSEGTRDPPEVVAREGKEANDSQFPLESHFFTTILLNKKVKNCNNFFLKNG